jgi:hypothetical protein
VDGMNLAVGMHLRHLQNVTSRWSEARTMRSMPVLASHWCGSLIAAWVCGGTDEQTNALLVAGVALQKAAASGTAACCSSLSVIQCSRCACIMFKRISYLMGGLWESACSTCTPGCARPAATVLTYTYGCSICVVILFHLAQVGSMPPPSAPDAVSILGHVLDVRFDQLQG